MKIIKKSKLYLLQTLEATFRKTEIFVTFHPKIKRKGASKKKKKKKIN